MLNSDSSKQIYEEGKQGYEPSATVHARAVPFNDPLNNYEASINKFLLGGFHSKKEHLKTLEKTMGVR